MEINITLSQIWNNPSIRDFLMRSQAQSELEKLLSHAKDEDKEEEDWLDHAHEVLDENFPEEDELVKDDFCCEQWQNGLSDEDNIANFKKYVKEIAED